MTSQAHQSGSVTSAGGAPGAFGQLVPCSDGEGKADHPQVDGGANLATRGVWVPLPGGMDRQAVATAVRSLVSRDGSLEPEARVLLRILAAELEQQAETPAADAEELIADILLEWNGIGGGGAVDEAAADIATQLADWRGVLDAFACVTCGEGAVEDSGAHADATGHWPHR